VVQTISAPARSWREWFAAIFSTPLLRYGVPALAMFALVAIVLVVATRNREEPSLVARGPDAQQPANTTTEDQKQGTANSTTGETSDAAATQGTPVSANANTGVANSNAPLDRAQQKDAATGNSGYQIDGVAPAAAPKTTDTTAAEPQPQNIQERRAEDKQSAPQPSQNSAATDTFENRAEKKKKEQDDVALAAQKQRESVTAAPGAAAGTVSSRRARGGETAASGSGVATDSARNETQKSQAGKRAPATVGRAMRDGADEDSAGETRSVAGKRFRRQKGVWVDTAYNSSRSPLRVRRGTEQYRALVADEPVIGTVSTSLAGDVIVVVKGRAYHIY